MGLYQALIESAPRFSDVIPSGFKKAGAKLWLISLREDGSIQGSPSKSVDFPHHVPKAPPGRTSGPVATLMVDKATYVFGGDSAKSRREHDAYLRVLRDCISDIRTNMQFTDESKRTLQAVSAFHQKKIGRPVSGINDDDLIAFQVENHPYLFSDPAICKWLTIHLGKKLTKTSGAENCCICGTPCNPLRIAEMIPLFRQRFPMSSVNFDAACSSGKKQLFNSPICSECSSTSISVLGKALENDGKAGKHCVVLARESKRSGTARPLANQIAVFWTKEQVLIGDPDQAADIERVVRLSLDDDEQPLVPHVPKPEAAHLKGLLESPWHCRGIEVSQVNPVGFYFAVLSPNKSRLVVREWLETDVGMVKECLLRYRQGLSIVNLATGIAFVPPMTLILLSLRGPVSKRNPADEAPRLAEIEPELLRQLIRCMYAGTPPPEALLTRAVQAFRAPASAADEGDSYRRLCDRRTALAAAIKLVLSYNNPNDNHAMEQLKTSSDTDCAYKRQSPYLCGRLLALLNDIQYRASTSRRGPNTTLVDKFYASASTAPQSVFGSLLKQANTAHLPKLRKDSSRNYAVKTNNHGDLYVTDLLHEIVNLIDADCGLPKQLIPRQQAEFALGYHHQQAILRPPFITASGKTEEKSPSKSDS